MTWAERPELCRGMYEVVLEAAADIPGDEEDEIEPFEDWVAHEMQAGPGDRPEATFVAVAGDEVIGYAKFSIAAQGKTTVATTISPASSARGGGAESRVLSSRRRSRGRSANGFARLETRNEERNAPIRKLNAELGYEPSGIRMLFRGPLKS